MIDKYFVRVYFSVQEHADKKDLNTPGGDEMMTRLGGKDTGLPFFAFLDSKGTVIVNSIEPGKDGKKGENIGHPDQPHEVDWFMTMLGKAAPGMTPEEKASIEKYLRNQKK